ncbi:MAG: hypothetical protein WCV62_01050 [Candidatus Peribacteraceae bacterium]|jgi:hypothetical protein
MGFDDDDLDEPLSGRKALERADHGKREKEDAKKQAQEQKELSILKLQVLRQGMAPLKPEEKGGDGKGEGIKTRTREEEMRQATDTVHTKTGPEALMKKEEQEKKVEEQAQYEQGKDQTA